MDLRHPASCLLLAEVVLPSTEHHLVLVVPTDQGRMSLDNLRSDIVTLERTGYVLWRIQCADNFNNWVVET
jgi:predicted transglutaminase-like cysteine proteinase